MTLRNNIKKYFSEIRFYLRSKKILKLQNYKIWYRNCSYHAFSINININILYIIQAEYSYRHRFFLILNFIFISLHNDSNKGVLTQFISIVKKKINFVIGIIKLRKKLPINLSSIQDDFCWKLRFNLFFRLEAFAILRF